MPDPQATSIRRKEQSAWTDRPGNEGNCIQVGIAEDASPALSSVNANIRSVAEMESALEERRTAVERVSDLIGGFSGSMTFVFSAHVLVHGLVSGEHWRDPGYKAV